MNSSMIPTHPGWYWWREKDSHSWEPLQIKSNRMGRELRVTGMIEEDELIVWSCGWGGMGTTALKVFGGEWGGECKEPA